MSPSSSIWHSARNVVGEGLISILMPCHNLASSIAHNIRTVTNVVRDSGLAFEIIAIDDGSRDETASIIRSLLPDIKELHPLILPRNVGKGAALRAGFGAARGTHIIFLDGDLDLPPEQIPTFFNIMDETKADVVIGSKQHPQSHLIYPWQRQVMSTLYYWFVKLLVGLPVRDTQTGLKIFTRQSLSWAFPRLLVKAFAFDLELLALIHQQGHRIEEAPITLDFHGKGGYVPPKTVRGIIIDTLAIFYRLKILRYYQSIPDTRMPDPPPLASIIIACPSATKYLDEAVDALKKQTYQNFEVIILPDSKTPRAWPEHYREIPTGKIRPAEKRNIGIQHARGDITVFLDDDAYPLPDWLEHGLVYFSIPGVAGVGGPAITPFNDPLMAQWGGKVYANRLVSGNYRYRYISGRVMEVDDYPSCNLFVRTSVLREIGGFRTDFWPGEDTYLCYDITQRLKQRIFYEPRSIVFHHRRSLFLPHVRQISRYALHRGYFARHFPATSRRLSYMLPSFFVLGVIFGGLAAFVWPFLRPFYYSALLLYGTLSFLSAASFSPLTWIMVWIGVVLTHFTYGVRFLQGILTPRLPGEVQRFDHPSESTATPSSPSKGQTP